MTETHAAGWLPDPLGRFQYRYWNGSEWTNQVSTNGSNETDPLGVAPTPADLGPPAGNGSPATSKARLQWPMEIRLLIFGGAAALVLGSFMPWVKASAGIFNASKNGIDGDGVLTLAAAVGIALMFWLLRTPKGSAWVVIALAGVATAIAAYDAADVKNKADELTRSYSGVSASVGIGLWIALIGGAVAFIGGILALNRGPETS